MLTVTYCSIYSKDATFFKQILKLRSVKTAKRTTEKSILILIPHTRSPENDQKKSKRNFPLNTTPSHIAHLHSKGLQNYRTRSADMNVTHVVFQRSTAQ